MKSNSTFYLPDQAKIIKQPLISSLNDSFPQNQKVDVVKLISKQEQSRVTKVDFKNYRSITKNNLDSSNILQKSIHSHKHEQEQRQTHDFKAKRQEEQHYQNRKTQTFLNNYENNSFIGFALYVLFMLLISIEVLATSYFASQHQNHTFYNNKGFLLILFSQLVYYLILRFLNTKIHLKLYTQTSLGASIKNILSSNANNKYYKDSTNFLTKFFMNHPHILLGCLLVCIFCSQAIYCWIISQSLMLFEQGSIYLVSTIYWVNFFLPVLVTFLYMNGQQTNKNWKMCIVPYLLGAFMANLSFQSKFLVILSIMKLIQSYLQSIQGVQMFHLNQLTKFALLIIWFIVGVTIIQTENGSYIFEHNFLKEWLLFCVYSAVVTLSFILTRIVATIYIKNKLYRYFYSQTHIDIAFIVTSLLMYATYFNFQDWQNWRSLLHCMISSCLLILLGIIMYLEGRQKEQLNIQIYLDDQQV